MIVTTTGFFNTGSSAITHIIKEFDNISNSSDVYEIRILYDPDGISDLEYHLVENPHRQNTSFAIKRFKQYVDDNSNPLKNHHYESICHGNFKKASYDYINQVTEFTYEGTSHLESYGKSSLACLLNRMYQKILRFMAHTGARRYFKDSLFGSNAIQYAGTYKSEKFIDETRKYIRILLSYFNEKKSDYVLLDQLVPPSDIERYVRYIPSEEDIRVFVVDRDPRDLYVTCKYFLNSKAIPCDSPDAFCDWFEWTRGQSYSKEDPDCVMRVQFEDLIYNYEEMRSRIIEFCNLGSYSCSNKGQIFKPEASINNTQVWHRYPESTVEVKRIEERLSKYCYDFDHYTIKPKDGSMFDC